MSPVKMNSGLQSTPDDTSRPVYWRSEEHLANSDRFRHWLEHEFPQVEDGGENGNGALDGVSRRGFLGIMGASMALAGFTGCRKPVEKIVPYVQDIEYKVHGKPRYYATAQPRGTAPLGLLVETHEGRPTKVEGNELHNTSGGGADSWALASMLSLYDPDRAKFPTEKGARRTWDQFVEAWREIHTGLVETRGKGFAVLFEPYASPTMARLHAQLKKDFPQVRTATWEPVGTENRDTGLAKALGRNVDPILRFDKAKVILSLDSDFITTEPDAVRHNRDFGMGRKLDPKHPEMNRLYVVEPSMTVTGGKADHRLRLQGRQIGAFAVALALELEAMGLTVPGARSLAARYGEKFQRDWVKPLAEDLVRHRGESLLTAGLRQPAAVHALVAAMNSALGNAGRTVSYRDRQHVAASDLSSLRGLVDAMNAGEVETLVTFGGNPVYDAPANLRFGEAVRRVRNTIHVGTVNDESARAVDWHVARSQYPESWGDAVSTTGVTTIVQPQIQPLYDTRADVEILNLLVTGEDTRGYDIVRTTWFDQLLSGDKERGWKVALHDGLLDGTGAIDGEAGVIDVTGIGDILRRDPLPSSALTGNEFELLFAPSPTMFDGRWANNAWLVEQPHPVTKASWGNHAILSPATAKRLGVKINETISVELNGASVELPVYPLPGCADNSITLELGWGDRDLGRVNAESMGTNVYGLRRADALGIASGATVAVTGRLVDIPNVQDHGSLEGRAILREADLETYKHDKAFAKHMVHVPDLKSLWDEHTYTEGYQWGMAIDLNACTNCNACVTACVSENNIPVVGKDRVRVGREMHWIRMDRYFVGDQESPRVATQPMMCQHCEMAPCEQVCPVNATVHDQEGLNVMTYNRCIGTRYCSNNCPYKVRRFNFFNYTNEYPEIVKLAQNPDVTVRSRGVMEKCTFCLQRISLAKQSAKADGRTVKDSDLQTACQQACPPNAISFGNINDPASEVSKLRKNKRAYGALEEFNTRPRVQYLAGVLNPNPKMPDQPVFEVEIHGAGHGGGHNGNGHDTAKGDHGDGHGSGH